LKNNLSDILDIISQKSQYISQIRFCSRDNNSTVFAPAIYAIVNSLFTALYPILILANIIDSKMQIVAPDIFFSRCQQPFQVLFLYPFLFPLSCNFSLPIKVLIEHSSARTRISFFQYCDLQNPLEVSYHS